MRFVFVVLLSLALVTCFAGNYRVTKKEVSRRVDVQHLTIHTELDERVSEEKLTEIAKELKGQTAFFRTWIFHYLEGYPDEPWATTHFDPELNVIILGSKSEIKVNAKQEEQVVGKWKSRDSAVLFYRKDGHLFIRWSFYDGSAMNERLFSQGNKYWYENDIGDHFRKTSSGDLEMIGGQSGTVTETFKKY